jgi:hypothetical protein
MRPVILAAASALAFAACTPSEPAADSAATAPAAGAAGHDMAAMDNSMKSSDTADDANTAETPEGYTFHSYPAKIEVVHLPAAADGGAWTATASNAALIEIGEQKDETMPDGAVHHTVKVTPKASGNAEVKFERRDTAGADAPVVETRTIKFMIH